MFTRLELKTMFSSDLDLRTWRPEDPQCFSFWLQLDIGQEGGPGADIFQAVVVTPEALKRDESIGPARHRVPIVLVSYDYDHLKDAVESTIATCNRLTWDESVDALRERFMWEYERT